MARILAAYLIVLTSAFRLPYADGVAGTWKRSAMTLVDASGKTTDMLPMLSKTMPCAKDITYTFSSDGQMKTNVPDACGSMKKTIESMNAVGRWSLSGNQLTVTTTMKQFPPAIYEVSFTGNTMSWVFNYENNPKTPNPTKAQRMTIVYQRI
ncbi:lipocalin-like domain-containing protein [Spirosoma koreense]